MSSPKSSPQKVPFWKYGLHISLWLAFVSFVFGDSAPGYAGAPVWLPWFLASMLAAVVFTAIWIFAVVARFRRVSKEAREANDELPSTST